MSIVMNKEFLEIITLFIFASPFIALVVIVGYNIENFDPPEKRHILKNSRKEAWKGNICRISQKVLQKLSLIS